MFSAIKRNLKTAWELNQCGAKAEALQALFFGLPVDEIELRTDVPLVQAADFYDIMEQLGVASMAENLRPGDRDRHYVGNPEKPQNICIDIELEHDYPIATVSILGRVTSMHINIKQNRETGVYQIDDAVISDAIHGENECPEIYNIPFEDCEVGRDMLPEFIGIFAKTSEIILSATSDTSAPEIELEMAKALKPLMAKAAELENAAREAEIIHQRAIGGPGSFLK
ncbi:MAG TPA: hypothetical protein PLF01_05035 [Alphaproteobacteria bacterium]|nr:hypothetical protein [Alphaproteobacteria bacterium]